MPDAALVATMLVLAGAPAVAAAIGRALAMGPAAGACTATSSPLQAAPITHHSHAHARTVARFVFMLSSPSLTGCHPPMVSPRWLR
jgi:hypothetical protein